MQRGRMLCIAIAIALISSASYVGYLKWDLSSEQIVKVAISPDGKFEARLSNVAIGAAPGAEEVLLIRLVDNRTLGSIIGRSSVVLRYSGDDPDELSFRWIDREKLAVKCSSGKKLTFSDAFGITVFEE